MLSVCERWQYQHVGNLDVSDLLAQLVAMPTAEHDRKLYRLVGRRIRQLRGNKLTQEELANLAGVARTSITNLERGRQRAPLHQLMRIADALGCEIHDLLPTMAELDLAGERTALTYKTIVGDVTPRVRSVLSKYVMKEVEDGP